VGRRRAVHHAGQYRLAEPKELLASDGVWLLSSGRGPAAVRSLDGVPLSPRPDLVSRLRDWTDFAAE
jgi:hypothetical protein